VCGPKRFGCQSADPPVQTTSCPFVFYAFSPPPRYIRSAAAVYSWPPLPQKMCPPPQTWTKSPFLTCILRATTLPLSLGFRYFHLRPPPVGRGGGKMRGGTKCHRVICSLLCMPTPEATLDKLLLKPPASHHTQEDICKLGDVLRVRQLTHQFLASHHTS